MVRRSPLGPDPYLWEILAHDGTSEVTLRFATHTITTLPTDTPPNVVYDGVVVDPGNFQHAAFEDAATSGRANVDVGLIELANTGELDYLYNYGWGRQAILRFIPGPGAPVSSAQEVLRTTIVGLESADAPRRLRLRARGRMTELSLPLLTERYAGTTDSIDAGAEGDANLTSQIKPLILGGPVTNVPAKLVNAFALVYQFCANEVTSITPYDGGIEISVVADYTSIDALINADIDPGTAATCLAQGAVRFGAVPGFEVTADITEETRSASQAVQHILDLAGVTDIDQASFDNFHVFNSAAIGLYLDQDRSIIDVISEITNSVGGGVIDNSLGVFTAIWLDEPEDGDVELTLRDLLSEFSMQLFAGPTNEGQGIPAWQVVVQWGRVWKTQSAGDLAALVTETDQARKQLLATQWRQSIASNTAVLTQHPTAVTMTFDTLLVNQVDADAEAARRLALYSVRRDRISFPVSFAQEPSAGDLEMGESVTVVMPRFGYDTGKNFRVIGRKDDFNKKIRTLNLWG